MSLYYDIVLWYHCIMILFYYDVIVLDIIVLDIIVL